MSQGTKPTIDHLLYASDRAKSRAGSFAMSSPITIIPLSPPPSNDHWKTELRLAYQPRTPKPEPTPIAPAFDLSPGLKNDLMRGIRPHSVTGHSRHDVDMLMERLFNEADEYAERKKLQVRVALKMKNEDKQRRLISKQRSLLRSRIEAKVSRVKSAELDKAVRIALRWLIENTTTKHPSPCNICDN